MSLVEDSYAAGNDMCSMYGGTHCKTSERIRYNRKDTPLRDITFRDAINFLRKVQEKW